MADPLATYAAAAARLLNCAPEDLLAFRFDEEDRQFIVIAPSGQKHRFELDQLENAMARHPEPVEGHPEPVEGHPEPVEGHPEPVEGHPEPVEGHPEPVEGPAAIAETEQEPIPDLPALLEPRAKSRRPKKGRSP